MTNDLTVPAANSMPALCRSMDDYMNLSQVLADSQFVPKDFRNRPADVLAAVLYGRSVGLDPMQALQSIGVINGKPSIYGDAALGLVRSSGIPMTIEETIEGEGDKMVAVCKVTRGKEKFEARFSVDDAKRASLWGKTGPWQQYPRRMLGWRARGFVLRDAFPDVLKGLITREEAQDYPQEPMKNITPAKEPPPPAPEPGAVWSYTLIGDNGEVKIETNSMAQIIEAVARVMWTNETVDANWEMIHRLRDDIGQQVQDRKKAGQATTKFEAALRQVNEIIDGMQAMATNFQPADQPEMADA